MWNRQLVKSQAKQRLRNFYWMAVLVSFCYGVAASFSSSGFSMNTGSYTDFDTINSEVIGFLVVMFLIYLVAMVISLVVGAFLRNPLEVGMNRYYLESRIFKSRFEKLFCVFTHGSRLYMNAVKTLFLRDVKVVLWSLLLLIPGIVKSYQYRMVPYLLSERPDMPYQRAFELSKLMTDGEKARMWVLDLSFIGWYLLCIPTCFIGFYFLAPYVQATYAEVYTALREKAFSCGYTDPTELAGFQPQ